MPNFQVASFPPSDAEILGLANWSLKPLQRQADVADNVCLVAALSKKLHDMDVREAFAPHVAPASGRVVTQRDLTDRIELRYSVLYRNSRLPADGVFLQPGQAFVMSAAGCALVVAESGENVIIAHAGRDSLIDRNVIMGASAREHFSIVHATVAALVKKREEKKVHPEEIVMRLFYAIPAEVFEHRFDHPQYGLFNQALAELVDERWPNCTIKQPWGMCLNIETLFVEQARELGLKYLWTGLSLADRPDLAHTRDGKDPARRNLFIVKRIN